MTTKKTRLIVELPKEEKEIYVREINKLGQTISLAIRRALKQYLEINN